MKNINFKGLFLTALNVIASFLFSFYLTPTLANNTDALNLVANVFSILSGFLLLVITMSGENSILNSSLSKNDKVNQTVRFEMRFNKYYSLFLIYIFTLALIFIYYLLSKDTVHDKILIDLLKKYLGYCISFLTFFAFVQSTFIPMKIKDLFKEKKDLSGS